MLGSRGSRFASIEVAELPDRSEIESCDKSQHSQNLEYGDLSPPWLSAKLELSKINGGQTLLKRMFFNAVVDRSLSGSGPVDSTPAFPLVVFPRAPGPL
jgi:hypothetical protein